VEDKELGLPHRIIFKENNQYREEKPAEHEEDVVEESSTGGGFDFKIGRAKALDGH
jgi:hypothetical protein